jgi:integrase
MKKNLYIPPTKRIKGLHIQCDLCGTTVSKNCAKTNKPLNTCINGDRQHYVAIIHVPGTKNDRKLKQLDTRDLDQAITETLAFKKLVKDGTHREESEFSGDTLKETRPVLFIDALAKYIDSLHGVGIPDYKAKLRSKKYLKDLVASYEFLSKCLTDKGINLSKFTITNFLTNEIVNLLYKALNSAPSGDFTYNKRLDCFQRFEIWLNRELGYPLQNLFNGVERRTVYFTSLSISKDEWARLLMQITPENGVKPVYNYVRRNRENYYKSWLIDGLQLALFTGARREEIVNLKFNDIIEEDGVPSYILIENLKVNRRKGLTGSSKQYIPYPISSEHEIFLNSLGYEKFKNTSNYLLAPEIIDNRLRMCDGLTKGFNHYYSQLNTGRKLTFKCLRKTNITALHLQKSDNIKPIHHSGREVEEKHYLDKQVMARNKNGFNIFPEENKKSKGNK